MSVWLTLMVVNKCVVILLGHLTVAVMVDTYSLVMEELVLVHIQLLLDTSNTCTCMLIMNRDFISVCNCLDIDECADNTDGCDQTCTNTMGSFVCSCDSGFTLSSDGRTCIENNECTLGTNNCEQLCFNTEGGFRCECNQGFQLNADQATCSGKLMQILFINF